MGTETSKTAGAKESLKSPPRRLKFHRFSAVELLVALALLFLFFPFVEEVKGRCHRIDVASVLLLSGLPAVADCKGVFFVALMLRIPAISGRWINHFWPDLAHGLSSLSQAAP